MSTAPGRWPTSRPRLVLKLHDWPEADRRLWLSACAPMDVLDGDGGSRSQHRAISNYKVEVSYGRWLAFLAQSGDLDPGVPPTQRITTGRVKAYVAELQARGNRTHTVLNRLQDLASYAHAVDPGFDQGLLSRIYSRVRATGLPAKDKRARMVPSDELFALGLRLMEEAGSLPTPRLAAIRYRNGLIIAFLALRPLRLRNLTRLQLGVSLVKVGERWILDLPGEETKNGTPFEATWPECLQHHLEAYLAVHRPVLAARRVSWARDVGTALWLAEGAPLRDGRMHVIICEQTHAAFGRAINPHLFRHAAATTWAIRDPAHVRGAASLLGHRSQNTTERSYQLAQSLEAQRAYVAGLPQRKGTKRSPRSTGGAG